MATIETEIKLRVDGAEGAKRRLEEHGFQLTIPRVLQIDQVYDLPDQALLQSGKLLRVRSTSGNAILTYKGPPLGGRHKRREELEATTKDVAALNAILNGLGYAPAFRYEKYRTTFQDRSGTEHAVAALDETPIGVFLELEGPEDWIDRTAGELGFQPGDYITASYGSLYREHLKVHGGPADMIFSKQS